MIREPERRVAMITICALLGIALYLVWQITAPFWSGIFLGIVLASPVIRSMPRWNAAGGNPALAALAATVAIHRPGGRAGPFAGRDRGARGAGPVSHAGFVEPVAGRMERLVCRARRAPARMARALHRHARSESPGGADVPVAGGADMALGRIGGLFGNVTSTLLEAIITFLTLYSFFRGAKHLRELAAYWVPLPLAACRGTAGRGQRGDTRQRIWNPGHGRGAGGFGRHRLRHRGSAFAVAVGVVATICSLVPMLGTALVWAPGAAVLLISGKLDSRHDSGVCGACWSWSAWATTSSGR